MTRVSTLSELSTVSAMDGDVVYVGRKRAYLFESLATDVADGWRVVKPDFGSGRWFRVEAGSPHIQLGDPGFEAIPSLSKTKVSGFGKSLILEDASDFVDQEHIAIYGAGEVCALERPTMPTPIFFGVHGLVTWQYCCAAVDEKLGVSQVSDVISVENGPEELDHDNYYRILFARPMTNPTTGVKSSGDFDENTRHIIVWRRRGTIGAWVPIHGLRVNVWRADDASLVSAPRIAEIVDNGKEAREIRRPFLPQIPPDAATRGIHYSKIISGGGSKELKIADEMPAPLSDGTIFHDAVPAIRNALDAFFSDTAEAGEIRLGSGIWPLHQPLVMDKRFIMSGQGVKSTHLHLYDGQYIHLSGQHNPESRGTTAQDCVVQDITITYRTRETIVCGAPVSENKEWPVEQEVLPKNHGSYQRLFPGEEHWTGAAVLITTSRSKLKNVHITSIAGHGIVLYGWPIDPGIYKDGSNPANDPNDPDSFQKRLTTNANLGYFETVKVSGSYFGHGIVCRGSDANIGLWQSLSVVGCDGWGFIDMSQHGHTLVAAHVSNNFSGAYASTNDLQTTWFFNCYSESGVQKVSLMGDGSGAVGGVLGAPWRKGNLGLRLLGRDEPAGIQPMLEVVHQDDKTLTAIGYPDTTSSELMRIASSNHDSSEKKMKYFKRRDGANISEHWGTTDYETSRITGVNPLGTGLIQYRRGILVGDDRRLATRRILVVPSEDQLPPGPYHIGDMFPLANGVDILRPKDNFAVAKKPWTKEQPLRAGDTRTVSNTNEFVLVATDVSYTDGFSGITGLIEPIPASVGQNIVDNTVTWTVYSSKIQLARISAT